MDEDVFQGGDDPFRGRGDIAVPLQEAEDAAPALFGDRLHVVVADAEEGRRRVLDLLEKDGNTPATAERIIPSLEDVFIHSIEAQGGKP